MYSLEQQIKRLQDFVYIFANRGCVYYPNLCKEEQYKCLSCKAQELLDDEPVQYKKATTTYGLLETPERTAVERAENEGMNPKMSGMKI